VPDGRACRAGGALPDAAPARTIGVVWAAAPRRARRRRASPRVVAAAAEVGDPARAMR